MFSNHFLKTQVFYCENALNVLLGELHVGYRCTVSLHISSCSVNSTYQGTPQKKRELYVHVAPGEGDCFSLVSLA